MANVKKDEFLNQINTFFSSNIREELQNHAEMIQNGANHVYSLYHDTLQNVPAYKHFIEQHTNVPLSVANEEEWGKIPLMDKNNYTKKYPLKDICRKGILDGCDFFAVSSGSSGEPTLWPRAPAHEIEIARRFEQIFFDTFEADKKSTLAIVCFPLGTWVGGMFTTNCLRYVSMKGYRITLITPGNNKAEILRICRSDLSSNYEQTVLLGYPPFIKDVIDSGIAENVNWKSMNIKMVFAGEVFSEEWRRVVGERAGFLNHYFCSVSMYGTADAGVLANETAISVIIREYLASHPEIAKELFGESRLPTLAQYDPMSRYFEVDENKTLLFSGNNGIPLIRYHIADNGGILSFDDMINFLKRKNFDPEEALVKISEENNREVVFYKLPFVYVFGRAQFAISYFGANIYVENVTVGLEQDRIKDWVTGKFVMEVKEDKDNNAYLSVTVELAPKVAGDNEMKEEIRNSILRHLSRLNSEFKNYVPVEKQAINLTLLSTGDPSYFPVGVKHRYTRKA